VLVRDLEHLRIQPRQDAGEDLRRQAPEVDHALAADHRRDALADGVGRVVGRPAQAELQVLPRVARQAAAGDEARAACRAGPVKAGRAGHERAVEVEEDG